MEEKYTSDENGTLLIVDDDPGNIDLLAEILEDLYEIIFATNGNEALKMAENHAPDLIILDVVMPEMDGYEVCTALKSNQSTNKIPVIFVTGLSSVSEEIRGLEVGAVDFITKPLSLPIVLMRVGNQMKLTKAHAKLERLSITDSLTELANRRHLDNRLALESNGLRKPIGHLSVILLDIDHFKAFNDTYGHIAGDECLKDVSRAIRDTVHRLLDVTARYGGEEFCCVLPCTEFDAAMMIAEKIRGNVEMLKILNRDSGVSQFLSVSLGVLTIVPNGKYSLSDIFTKVDKNLYTAKESGRNRVIGSEEIDCEQN